MKKTIRKIFTVLLVAVLFISCNADIQKQGIFESMMNSAPKVDFTIKKFSGVLGNKFIIETNNGVELLSRDGKKDDATFIEGLKASVKFLDNDFIFFSVEEEGKQESTLYYAPKSGDTYDIENKKPAVLKTDDTELRINASFFEQDSYVLLMAGKDGSYYLADTRTAGLTQAGDTFTFTSVYKTAAPEKDPESKAEVSAPVYIGGGFYYVEYLNNYYIYSLSGSPIQNTDGSPKFAKMPIAVEDKTLFIDDLSNNLYNISTGKAVAYTPAESKHTIAYQQINQDIPMTTGDDGRIYGFYGSKPFTVKNGTEKFQEHDTVGSGTTIIDLYRDGSNFYAFSSSNGLFLSTDGKTYTQKTN